MPFSRIEIHSEDKSREDKKDKKPIACQVNVGSERWNRAHFIHAMRWSDQSRAYSWKRILLSAAILIQANASDKKGSLRTVVPNLNT